MPLEAGLSKWLSSPQSASEVADQCKFRIAIQIAMAEKGMRIKDLAKFADVSVRTMSRILNDRDHFPELATLGKIAEALGLDIERLVASMAEEKAQLKEETL